MPENTRQQIADVIGRIKDLQSSLEQIKVSMRADLERYVPQLCGGTNEVDLGICAGGVRQATGILDASLGWVSGRSKSIYHGENAVSHRSQLT